MSKTIKTLLALVLMLSVCTASHGQTVRTAAEEKTTASTGKTATFVFRPGEDMFLLKGNEAELERLYALVDEYRTDITAGRLPVYVDGYCASMPTAKENLGIAFTRANRVKSELIQHKGMAEADFITANYARTYHNNKDVVVVTLRIPAKEEPKQPEAVQEQPKREEQKVVAEQKPKPVVEEEQPRTSQSAVPSESIQGEAPYCFAIRTNVLYDALLLPTLGVEWRVNRDLSVKLDGSLAWWGGNHGKVQKMWLVNPEVRWYLLHEKRFYVGASGTYGEYNIYKYPLGSILSKDTGYQGKLWNAGLTVGYQLPLSRCFSIDFNLGLGYTRSEYDSFGMTDGVRVYKERNRTKNLWGPTQAGISLVWTIGGNK
ncbi:DUF3575 domain-containing protein [Bacteroides thetaiotaomicron]|uniref:DUF3575 domain-containing protein n=1 Tax=Bacteroides thetaiotaomicron TaxID=818 RepID=UPI001CE33ACB|nr:DUF3575 domain-containing protein [Bacteroides thetaiotaomicron]MCA6029924.1 DUF3575 domain-containing protein [Bacteroides thetaiotaomicron]